MRVMKITEDMLTEQQKSCINFPMDRDLLVRGVAGSGKSLVIVNRAILLAKKAREKGKVPTSLSLPMSIRWWIIPRKL